MPPPDIALLTDRRYTAETVPPGDWYLGNILADDGLLRDALARRGLTSARVDWADPAVDCRLDAFFGSALMSLLGVVAGAPIGILAGTFLAEFGRNRWAARLAGTVRFVNDILLSAPSIVLGLFVYTLVVAPSGHFSALAGGIALALIVLPVVVRTTDEMLRLVPAQMREAALSLGVPQWKVTVQVLYRASLPGIATGILLALARISGETAPLLFTALNNQYWSADVSAPMANVPVVIFQYAMSPYDSWHSLAWAGAFVLTLFVLLVSLLARAVVARNRVRHD